MKQLLILALLVASCGGGDPPITCSGKPKAALVYVGAAAPPVPDTCAVSVPDNGVEALRATVDQAKAAAGALRVHLVTSGTAVGLDYMGTYPGHVDSVSVWLAPFDPATTKLGGLRNSIIPVFVNGGDCDVIASRIQAQGTPAVCAPAVAFDPVEALRQLHLELIP